MIKLHPVAVDNLDQPGAISGALAGYVLDQPGARVLCNVAPAKVVGPVVVPCFNALECFILRRYAPAIA